MKLHIEVTQEDIAEGQRNSGVGCMVYRAFMRATEGAYGVVRVHSNAIGIYDDATEDDQPTLEALLPVWVRKRIRRWDRGNYNWQTEEWERPRTRPFAFDTEVVTA